MPLRYHPPGDATAIAALDRDFGHRLPADYRDFLARSNGLDIAAPGWCQIPFARVDDGEVAFGELFGLGVGKGRELRAFNREFIDEIAFVGDCLAIGEDGGGNPYVLMLEDTPGAVLYWDRTHLHRCGQGGPDFPEQDDSGDLYRFAGSFTELLALVQRHAT